MTPFFQIILISLFAFYLCLSQPLHGDPTLIQTKSGLIQGSATSQARMFQSIPYAAPPIDNLRWAEPQPVEPWNNNTLNATMDPPGCPQSCTLPPKSCPLTISEDCLYLNIFTPLIIDDQNDNDKLPVLVFIHGGNFKQGYGGGLLYNGTNFVNYTKTILVTINYRLGALGQLWSIEAGMNGNYGFLDQKMALKWVHSNIEYFGGNQDQITLFGQSAGAISVALHMSQTSEDDVKLFNFGIMESEPFGIPLRDTTTWGLLPKLYFDKVGCKYDEFFEKNPFYLWQCLRNRTIDQIMCAQNECELATKVELNHELDLFMPWTRVFHVFHPFFFCFHHCCHIIATVGTDLFSAQPIVLFQESNVRDMPFILGTVRDEGRSFVYGAYPDAVPKDQVFDILALLIGPENAIKVREHYPFPKNTSDYRDYMTRIATDGLFKCPTRNVSAEFVNNDDFDSFVYLYHFNHASSFNKEEWNLNYTMCWGDTVCHAEELTYVFHPDMAPINASYTLDEDDLAMSMQAYWTQFAEEGSPGNGGNINPVNTEWFPFILGSETSLQFEVNAVEVQSEVDYRESKCAFWDTLNYDWIK